MKNLSKIFNAFLSAIRYPLSAITLLCIALIPLFTNNEVYANQIGIDTIKIGAQDTTADTLEIEFNIGWSNSWRDTINYDAVWVFIKYSIDGGTTWNHAYISTTLGDHTIPSGYEGKIGTTNISGTDRGMGIFLQRSATGSGTASLTGVKLKWKYGENGITDSQASHPFNTVVKVMGMEMVYIPEGSFSLGSGGAEAYHFYKYPTTSNTYTVSSEGAINVGTTTDYLYYASGGGDQTGPIPADFPKGYNDFYIMKYEISQDQWKDFFNTLTADQKTTRDITGNHATYGGKNVDTESYRNSLSWSSGNATASSQFVACNWLCWADLTAYADWAGLRPMTELEFEKACRGTIAAVANEYVWGNTTITQAQGPVVNSTNQNETATTTSGTGLCNYDGAGTDIAGPLRCGFAATATTSRQGAAATYYGVMNMADNCNERAVSVGLSGGRTFTGLHGDGALDASGEANVTNWPTSSGGGFRGTNWGAASTYATTSDRTSASGTTVLRHQNYGGRLVRTAP